MSPASLFRLAVAVVMGCGAVVFICAGLDLLPRASDYAPAMQAALVARALILAGVGCAALAVLFTLTPDKA